MRPIKLHRVLLIAIRRKYNASGFLLEAEQQSTFLFAKRSFVCDIYFMKITDYLSKDEFSYFRTASDLMGGWRIAFNYLLIAACFILFALYPNPMVFALGVLVLAGRILGLLILNHDAAHHSLFKTRTYNRLFARWLLAGPTLSDFDSYRETHLKHHKYAGTLDDPDISFVDSYPAPIDSIKRKFSRDLTGRTGIRDLLYLIKTSDLKSKIPFFVSHAVAMMLLVGFAGWKTGLLSYSMWWVAFLFVFPAVVRLRIMGEHGAVEKLIDSDPRRNTRTTLANPLERLFVAPNFVNYHCEHHVLANVPGHKLPEFHTLLKQRGFYEKHPYAIERGYVEIIRQCIRP